MLLRLIMDHFLSFDEPAQFDMFPNLKRTSLANHICEKGGLKLLKMSAIYGPNAAGKSNVIKALKFLKKFATKSDFLNNNDIEPYIFCLKEEKNSSLNLVLEFSTEDDSFFVYNVEIFANYTINEDLYESFPLENKFDMIYSRKGFDVKGVNDKYAELLKNILRKNKRTSLLALNSEIPILEDKRVNKVYSFFRKKLKIIDINTRIPDIIELVRKNDDLLAFTKKIFSYLGLGIDNLQIKDENFDQWIKNHNDLAKKIPALESEKQGISLFENERQLLSIKIENGIQKVYKFIFDQIGKNGYKGQLGAEAQSDGTIRLLTLVPALYGALKRNETVVIDEINHCLHPTLVAGFVRYFVDNNSSAGQLIFTTHDVNLLDARTPNELRNDSTVDRLLRSDEVWFVDKVDGCSTLYSHNNFKEHNTISMLRGYLEGRYGAIRYWGNK